MPVRDSPGSAGDQFTLNVRMTERRAQFYAALDQAFARGKPRVKRTVSAERMVIAS